MEKDCTMILKQDQESYIAEIVRESKIKDIDDRDMWDKIYTRDNDCKGSTWAVQIWNENFILFYRFICD